MSCYLNSNGNAFAKYPRLDVCYITSPWNSVSNILIPFPFDPASKAQETLK